MARNSKKNQQADKHAELLATNMKRFDNSWKYASQSWHQRWERDWKLYNNKRVLSSYEGISNTFVPMVFSTIETMVAALGNGRPRFDYVPDDPTQEADTKTLNALIDDYWEGDRWDVKIIESMRQMLTVGTAPLFIYWDIDRPRLIHFSIKDAIIDPTATNPDELKYAGRRYLTTLDELKSYQAVDADPNSKTYGELKDRFKNLDQINSETSPSGKDDTDRAKKEMFTGSTLPDAEKSQIEVIEIWDKERVVSIANRTWVIEDIENPYLTQDRAARAKRYMPAEEDALLDPFAYEEAVKEATKKADLEAYGCIPFVFLRNYTDVSLFYAKSEIEPIAPLQEFLNDFKNMEGDAIIKQLAQQRELDPAYEDYIDLINDDPSTVYPFKPGSLMPVPTPVIPPNAFNAQMNTKTEIRETTAVDQVAKGVQNTADSTATEVRAQLNQAGQRIELKARMLEKDGFYYLGKLLFKMIQMYVDEPMAVKMNGVDNTNRAIINGITLPKGVGVFDPAHYYGEWQPHVSLETSAQSKKYDDQRSARDAFQILIQDPTNNLEEIKKIFLPKMMDLEPEELTKIITPPPMPEMPGGGMPGEEASPEMLGVGEQPQLPMEVPSA